MKNHRKLISVILIICIALSIFPVNANMTSSNQNIINDTSDRSNYDIQPSTGELMDVSIPLTSNNQIFRFINEEEFISREFVSRVFEEETLNTYVFKSADGEKSIYFFDENVKYYDENNNIREKNISLVNRGESYGVSKSDIDLILPKNINEGIAIEYYGRTVRTTPLNPVVNANATIQDNSVVYEGVFGPKTTLVYTPLLSGVKEDIILSEYIADASFSFVVETNGFNLYNNEKGCYVGRNEDRPYFDFGEIIIYDAIGKPSIGDITVEPIEEGKRYIMTITVDDAFLSDAETVYPVTIDPSITISDNSGTGNIEDAPIYSGRPTRNFGAYTYNRVGSPDESYGSGRTVVRLTGLISSHEYQYVTANEIINVSFYVKDSSGNASQYINLYPMNNTAWTESEVTWNNVGTYNASVNFGTTLPRNNWATFDITQLVKGWKNNTYSANAGFIMVSSDETVDKSFLSSEYSVTENRPYVVMTYIERISIDETEFTVNKGGTVIATATTNSSNPVINWTVADTSIATVNASGVITGIKLGTTTLTASITDENGTHTDSAQVHVIQPDGVYYIKNKATNRYMHVKDGKINNAFVVQNTKVSSTAPDLQKIPQMWKIQYLEDGKYLIRPMHKLDMLLTTYDDSENTPVEVFQFTSQNTSIPILDYCRWTISEDSDGYIFQNEGDSDYTLQMSSAVATIGVGVVAGAYNSTQQHHKWVLEAISSPPSGIVIYDFFTGYPIANNEVKYIAPEETRTLNDMTLVAAVYSGSTNSQDVIWDTSSPYSVSVDINTGDITGNMYGIESEISATQYLDGNFKSVKYLVKVTEIPEGTYYIRSLHSNRYVDIENQVMSSGTQIHQWQFHGGNTQKWIFQHLGNGYYSIRSANATSWYSLGVINDSQEQNANVILKTSAVTDGMMWKIIRKSNPTVDSFIIKPKTGEEDDRVLAIGLLNSQSNGGLVQQRQYIDDDNLKDEWMIERANSIVKVDFSYDNEFVQRYSLAYESDPSTMERFENNLEEIYFYYVRNAFAQIGINITLNNISNYTSDADLCESNNAQNVCVCIDASDCLVDSHDDPRYNNSFVGFSNPIHCKSLVRLRNNLIVDLPTDTIRVTFSGSVLCNYCEHDDTSHNLSTAGLSNFDFPIIAMCPFNVTDETITLILAHELSHTYGAIHHATSDTPCIMDIDGIPQSIDYTNVAEYWCDDCIDIMSLNKYRY